MALAIGCSEDKKIEIVPIKKLEKIVKTPKIKTVDELFAAMDAKFKDYKMNYPLVIFATEKTINVKGQEKHILTSKSITYRTSSNDHDRSIYSSIDQNGKVGFLMSGNNIWHLIANKSLSTERTYDFVGIPDIVTDGKTKNFKNFFKELHLSNDIAKINGKICYKLTAITNQNNPAKKNITYIYWFDCEKLLKIKEKYFAFYGKQKIILENNFTYKLINGQYQEYQTKGSCKLDGSNKPFYSGNITTNKVVENVPIDESLFKCPKDKNDYKKLQTFFNSLLKKYYDNKYQIEIK